MAKTYIKHIVLSICIWAALATGGFCQQTDSAAKVVDTVVVYATPAVGDSTTSQADDEDTVTRTALNKFALRDTNFTAKERQIAPEEEKKITSDDAFWYANKPVPKENEVQVSTATPIIFWIVVAGCFIGILVMFLTSSKVWVFKSKARSIGGEETDVIDDAERNIFDIDFEKRIKKALDGQDYRLATRLLFLHLLRSMAEKNIIKYGIDKTNMDYLFELGRTKYYKDFSTAARNYEYVWYGNFSMQQSQFVQVKQLLEELTRQIKN